MKIIIVDQDDNIIGDKDRDQILSSDIYRVASLWIMNSNGEILLALRAYTKSHNPGVWAPPVNGTVESGETYKVNIKKEAQEELGVVDYDFQVGPKYFSQGKYLHYTQIFLINLDWSIEKFRPDPKEIAELKWISVEELRHDVKQNPDSYVHGMPIILEAIYGN